VFFQLLSLSIASFFTLHFHSFLNLYKERSEWENKRREKGMMGEKAKRKREDKDKRKDRTGE
jgi:hypothetical protein